MLDAVGESAIELAVLLLLSAASLLLIGAGLLIEVTAIDHVLTGDTLLGVWEGAFGLILLYAGVYAVGYNEVLTRLRNRLRRS